MSGDLPPAGGVADPEAVLDLRWRRSYSRTSVEDFVAAVARERERLEAQVEVARQLAEALRVAAGGRMARSRAELATLVLAAQREIAEIEHEHRTLIDSIRSGARAEAERLLAAAEAEAAVIRGAASSLSAHSAHSAQDDRRAADGC